MLAWVLCLPPHLPASLNAPYCLSHCLILPNSLFRPTENHADVGSLAKSQTDRWAHTAKQSVLEPQKKNEFLMGHQVKQLLRLSLPRLQRWLMCGFSASLSACLASPVSLSASPSTTHCLPLLALAAAVSPSEHLGAG